MKETILFLGPEQSPLLAWLREQGEEVRQSAEKVVGSDDLVRASEFLVSYGYRHILRKDVLDRFPGRAVNLHISLLPWNRGADPNFWSFIDGTPKGVTIHLLDEGIDTGDILYQKEVALDSAQETLASSYDRLQGAIQDLFKGHWPDIRAGRSPRRKQAGAGTLHRIRDREPLSHLLTEGWNTPVTVLENWGARRRAEAGLPQT